ncbi:hypothetical protein [Psychromonas sp. SP041]|uniref:hypothetical protein n=1 Tax=Psychromonas sp. SP041 TaxID=1365007 RepID=UPI00042365CD|nr:hypothetical protein [Psychromonas sp. SP041]
MGTSTASDSDSEAFFTEVKKSLKKLAKRHGFEVPDFNALVSGDGSLFMNVTAYPGKAKDHYEKMYRQYAHEVGMDVSWIGAEVFSKDKTNKYILIGMDPDGGPDCLRVKDKNGVEFHMSPSGFTHLMLK